MTAGTLRAAALAAAVLTVAPAAARAGEITIGSDLSAPASLAHSDPNDILFWGASHPAATLEVPVEGQAIIMRLKGGTLQPDGPSSNPDYDQMRFVVLRRQGYGTWRIKWSSVPLKAPVIGPQGNADEHTISSYTSEWPLCVEPGDRIGMVSVGGYDQRLFPQGLPYQVFARAPGAVVNHFAAGGALEIDETVVRGDTMREHELLLQVVIGTEEDARATCGGSSPIPDPGKQPDPPPTPGQPGPVATATLPRPDRAPRLFSGGIRLPVKCTAAAACAGTITVDAKGKRLGTRDYALAPGRRIDFSIKFTRKGRRLAERKHRLKATVTVTAGDRRSSRTVAIRS